MGVAQSLGSGADLFDGGALVGADDLPFVEEDHRPGDAREHVGRVRRQPVDAASFEALCIVDEECAHLAGGAD